ncbi:hypothetical protein K9L97_02835 [Candidatus Woesearchaeota archaeon]|nr:hypothetical protein [Candidatus Woesearchaeota archaeon]
MKRKFGILFCFSCFSASILILGVDAKGSMCLESFSSSMDRLIPTFMLGICLNNLMSLFTSPDFVSISIFT